MIYDDKIYGRFRINGIAEKIIMTSDFQRLKSIHQNGVDFLVNKKINTTRYEHCIGVYYLVRFFGGSIKEQIAGLLHDISHTVFSHAIDHIMDYSNEDFHEILIEKFVNSQNISDILRDNGLDPAEISNHRLFPLVKMDSMDLYCDKLDYCLRDLFKAEVIDKSVIKNILSNIYVDNGALVCKSLDSANTISKLFFLVHDKIYFNPLYECAHILFIEIMKDAINMKVIKKNDLFLTDADIMKKLNDNGFGKKLSFINSSIIINKRTDGYYTITRKLRIVDPFLRCYGIRLSQCDRNFKNELENFIKKTELRVSYDISGELSCK